MHRYIGLTILLASSLLPDCKEELRINLSELNKDQIYFGSGFSGAEWFGYPVFVNRETGMVEKGMYPTSVQWAQLCTKEIGDKSENALKQNFNLIALRDSIRSSENKAFWEKARQNVIFVSDRDKKAEDFAKLFAATDIDKAKAIFSLFRNPVIIQDFDPNSTLGFSRTNLDGTTQAKMADKLQANLHFDTVNLNFFILSEWGHLSLASDVKGCLLTVASTMNPRPTHIVDSEALGVMFRFSLSGTNVNTTASTLYANTVELSAKVNLQDVHIDAFLHGDVNTPTVSISEIYDQKNRDQIDKKIIEYFKEYSRKIETPVLVGGHLAAVPTS